jgi:predicted dehydrogenase
LSSAPAIRLGVAGLGGMGLVHAQNAAGLPGARLVAVAAARPGRADEVAAGLAARPCTYDELFAAGDVDGVVVAARSVDHADVAAAALDAGKHVLLEKPGATTLDAHDRLRRAAADRPELVLQLGYQRRFDAAYLEARRLVDAGAIGEPLLVLATSRDTEWPEGEDPADTGGFLLDMAVHDYDAACWFLCSEPVEVAALRQARVYPALEEAGDLDNAVVTIRFADGRSAFTHVSRTCAYGHDIRCEIVGRDGSVFVGMTAFAGPSPANAPRGRRRGLRREAVGAVTASDRSRFPLDFRERFADAYRAELAAFVEACRSGPRAGPGLAEDRRAVEIGVAARASAVSGEPLAVGRDWPWPAPVG